MTLDEQREFVGRERKQIEACLETFRPTLNDKSIKAMTARIGVLKAIEDSLNRLDRALSRVAIP